MNRGFTYKNGFGNGWTRNAWLGLDRIHALSTKDLSVTLRIDIYGNQCDVCVCHNLHDGANAYSFGEWNFYIDNELDNYKMHLSLMTGGNLTARNGLFNQYITKERFDLFHIDSDDQPSSTIDRDNDADSKNCVGRNKIGAWWHRNRLASDHYHLNGKYDSFGGIGGMSIIFESYVAISPVRSQMKLRKNLLA